MKDTPQVLLVEDNESLSLLLSLMLKRHGISAATAANGREALLRLKQRPFDYLVTDLVLPEVSGISLIRILQRIHPEIPVLAITGMDEETGNKALDAGARLLLYKPFSPSQFLQAFDRLRAGDATPVTPRPLRFSA